MIEIMNIWKFKQLILFAGDILALVASLYLALSLRWLSWPTALSWQVNWQTFWPLFCLWFLTVYLSGLYQPKSLYPKTAAPAIIQASIIAFVFSIIYFYIKPANDLTPKTILVLFTLIAAVWLFVWRWLFRYLSQNNLPRIPLGFIGYHPRLRDLIDYITRNPHLGYDIKFILTDTGLPQLPAGILASTDINSLPELIKDNRIEILVLNDSVGKNEDWQRNLFACLPLGVSYVNLSDFYEHLAGKIPLEIIDKSWFLENLNLGGKKYFEVIKRSMDFVFALIIFTVSLPFWPLIALLIKLESTGPAFFQQNRVGQNDKIFEMIKFRTMTTAGNNFQHTAVGDKRITRVGNFLRKTRLDEIPQVINILRGEMSFIGPRPERPEYAEELEKAIPYYRSRNLIKPGLTGWDQISGEYHSPSIDDTFKKLEYDLFYLKNRSWYLDLTIILKTVKTMISREGR
jgi:exopolysaccharide biosynthesis polyprenyl glycosylphosphotransferase